jgi:hypothetical protein
LKSFPSLAVGTIQYLLPESSEEITSPRACLAILSHKHQYSVYWVKRVGSGVHVGNGYHSPVYYLAGIRNDSIFGGYSELISDDACDTLDAFVGCGFEFSGAILSLFSLLSRI